MRGITTSAALLLIAAGSAVADTIYCNSTSACPEDYPCCSSDGICGTGYVCLGGCNPRYSYSVDSCMPMPICESGTTTFDSLDGIVAYADYLGNATESPWSYVGEALLVDDHVRLTMRNGTTGTALSSSRYMWYGKMEVIMKTSHLAGVVSDAIMLSNVLDEIDFEFVGTELTTAETNYYYEGIPDYDNEVDATVSNSTYDNFHNYTVDWTEDSITWYVDGTSVRTLTKDSTYNSTTGNYAYPQTPARIQLGLWPGGSSAQAEGTIEWAGGAINWDASDLTDPGYYFVELESVTISCYDPPSSANVTGSNAYVYTSTDVQSDDVAVTDDDTVLGNSDGTGLDPSPGSDSSSSGSAATTLVASTIYASSDVATTINGTITTVGVLSEVAATTLVGTIGNDGTTLATATSSGAGSESTSGSDSDSGSTGFVQGGDSDSASSSTASASGSTSAGSLAAPSWVAAFIAAILGASILA